ncbi:hypothetical protein J3F84DRAFT_383615 [Trichoderma pleuroticola]
MGHASTCELHAKVRHAHSAKGCRVGECTAGWAWAWALTYAPYVGLLLSGSPGLLYSCGVFSTAALALQ